MTGCGHNLAHTRIELPRLSIALEIARTNRDEVVEAVTAGDRLLEQRRSEHESAAAGLREARQAISSTQEEIEALERARSTLEKRSQDMLMTRPDGGPRLINSLSVPDRLAGAVAACLGQLTQSAKEPKPGEQGVRPVQSPTMSWRAEVEKAIAAANINAEGWLNTLLSLPDESLPGSGLSACFVLRDSHDLDDAWAAVAKIGAGTVDTAALILVALDGSRRRVGELWSASTEAREDVDREVEIQRLREESGRLEESLRGLTKRLADLESAAREAEVASTDSRQEFEAASTNLVHLRADLAAAEGVVHRGETDLSDCRRRLAEREQREESMQSELAKLNAASSELDETVERLQREIESGDAELTQAAVDFRAAEEHVRELRAEVALVDREVEIEQAELRRVTLLVQAADRERSELAALIETALQARDRAESERLAAESAVKVAETELEEARIGVAESPPDPRDLESDGAFQELRGLHERIEQVVAIEQKHRSELDHLEEVSERLLAECRLDLEIAPADLPEPEETSEYSDIEIRRLRVRAEQASDVEPGAPEEYRLLAERRDTLDRELTDLREASEGLESMLGDADREVRRRFRLTFTEVNDLFGQFFTEIFGGGSAQLVLESLEDVESVEIIAQLPGKRARDLSGLSGGERTLVAGAFLFALISASPPPFCVLDEVDAALDETNVDRYLGVMRQLANDTQFVVVTHNRGTMAAADTLYGIVLDPNGGSRALSLRLDQAVAG